MRKFTDPIEIIVADALDKVGIQYTHESQNKQQGFDFKLTYSGVHIECKQFPTDRTERQLLMTNDIILIQGRAAAIAFADMIGKY